MADDPNPSLRAELMAALAVIDPQIRGLDDVAIVSVSADLAQELTHESGRRKHRRDLIQQVLGDLDRTLEDLVRLEEDGYPNLAKIPLTQALLQELQVEQSDISAAVGVFGPEGATQLRVTLGEPADKDPSPSKSRKRS